MMSANSYLDHASQQREFVSSHRYSPYWWGNSTCDEIDKNMNLSLLNICKAVLVLNNISFQGKSDDEIISFVSTNQNYSGHIGHFLNRKSLWKHAAKRRDRNSRNYSLALCASYLEEFEMQVRQEAGML